MLCSNCSEPLSPIVAVDIDGTLGEYHEWFTEFACGWLGREVPAGYDGSMPFNEYLGLDKDLYRKIKLAYRQGGMKRTMPMRKGADVLMKTLKELDVEVWITTTRPYLRLDNIDPDTRHWMERHGLEYDHMLYDELKYQQLAEYVNPERVVMILEDDPEQIDFANGVYKPGVAVQAAGPHNNHPSARRSPAAGSLYLVADMATRRIQEWKETHGNT